jgi:hypothetical protein
MESETILASFSTGIKIDTEGCRPFSAWRDVGPRDSLIHEDLHLRSIEDRRIESANAVFQARERNRVAEAAPGELTDREGVLRF